MSGRSPGARGPVGVPSGVTPLNGRLGSAGHIRVVAAIIDDGRGRMLMVRKRDTETFILPGGKPEPGEGLPQAVARELDEELGLDIDVAQLDALGDFDTTAANEAGHSLHASVFVYRPGGDGRLPMVRAEIAEAAWLPFDPLPELPPIAPLTRDHAVPAYLGRPAR